MSSFTALVGQNQAVELLEEAVVHNCIAPAYLFTGSTGIGRSLAAKCFTEILFCLGKSEPQQSLIIQRLQKGNHPDLLWSEPTYLHQGQLVTASEAQAQGLKRKMSPQIRIEQIRQITQFLARSPLEASRLIVVIEAAETMTEAAANALLKTLEEPGQATLILITPSTESLLPTLVSRCQRIPFTRLSQANLIQVLSQKGEQNILQDRALLAIAQGSPGAALKAYSHLQTIPPDLLKQLIQVPKSYLQALQVAQQVVQQLETETQLWLLDYLQYQYWHNCSSPIVMKELETAKKYLLNYVQPRLVWECALMKLVVLEFTNI